LRTAVAERKVEHLEADFADRAAPAAVMGAATGALRSVDILVANHARSSHHDLEHLTAAELDLCFAVNARATLLLVQAFASQHDDARPGGRVVLSSSGQHRAPMPSELPYAASKAAVQQLT